MNTENDLGYPETSNPITWPTIQQQIDHWNKKEGEELERVSRIQDESLDKRGESRDATNETREVITSPIFPPIGVRGLDWCAVFDGYEPGCPIGHGATEQEAIDDLRDASNPQEQAATAAKTLTQEEENELCEIYDEREREWSLRDAGSNDGEGESYASRNA